MPAEEIAPANSGTIISVRGSVVDVHFDERLPPIYSVLRAGAEKQIVIEVLAQAPPLPSIWPWARRYVPGCIAPSASLPLTAGETEGLQHGTVLGRRGQPPEKWV
jgi:hypothetical protein